MIKGVAGRLINKEAAAYIEQKRQVLPTETWRDIVQGAHAKAFVIAGCMKTGMLEAVYNDINIAVKNGTGLAEFKKNLRQNMVAHGWLPQKMKEQGANIDNGKMSSTKDAQKYFGWRARVIYETNMKTAFAAAHWESMQSESARESHPYLMYRHGYYGVPKNPRDDHKAWDGKILPKDDVWWETHGERCGWGCNCGIVELTAKQAAQKLGKALDDLGDNKSEAEFWQNERKKGYPAGVSARSNWGIQQGWNYNPGIHTESGDLSVWEHVNNPKKCPPELKTQFLKRLHENSAEIYKHSLDLWVDCIYGGKIPSAQGNRTIGWTCAALGGKPIVANFRDVKHSVGERKDRSEKGKTDQRITKEWAKKIPQILAKPDSVYWDQKEKSFLYYKNTGDGKEIKVVLKKGLFGGKPIENHLKLETCVIQNENIIQGIHLLAKKRDG